MKAPERGTDQDEFDPAEAAGERISGDRSERLMRLFDAKEKVEGFLGEYDPDAKVSVEDRPEQGGPVLIFTTRKRPNEELVLVRGYHDYSADTLLELLKGPTDKFRYGGEEKLNEFDAP